MFTPDDLLALRDAQPFVPFRFHLSDGRTVDVPSRHLVPAGRQFAVVGIPRSGSSDDAADSWTTVWYTSISRAETLTPDCHPRPPMLPADLFRFCPRCAAPRPAANIGQVPLRCDACGLTFFFNPTVAAAAYVFDPAGRALFIRRDRDPAKGKLAIPGGFVDIGETADEALRREVREEVGLEITAVSFLTSFPNRYPYREVTYPVLDLVFTAAAVRPETARSLDGVAGLVWQRPADVDPDELAFPSIREGLKLLRERA